RAAVGGASSGLGLATARALIEAGVRVAVCGRDADRLAKAARELGPNSVPIAADLSTPEGAMGFIEEATEALGGIDILVPNSGGPPPGDFASTDLDAYGPALSLNLLSVVALCKAAVPGMQAAGWGRVVAITSSAVRQPIDQLILSNTARAGATGFLKTLANQVARDGITVNSLQPGLHATARLESLYGGNLEAAAQQTPTGTVGDPEDFGRIAAFLCSQHARFITGAAIPVDGGVYPGLL
ncbi:MAG: SDR family oxidoreductase, partial [Myxococcota bacterium]